MTAEPAVSGGLSPRALTLLAYLGGWTTGALVWMVARGDVSVRFHAAQSVLLFGGLSLVWMGLWTSSFLVLTVSAGGFTFLQRLSQAVLVGMLLLWGLALWKAWRHRSWRVPPVAGLAERMARRRARP